ncbi:MAG: anti-sigma factor antagonist, partial [Gallionella sp.]|nr:anti-sigma factor antagonist [Gallionella sp.]
MDDGFGIVTLSEKDSTVVAVRGEVDVATAPGLRQHLFGVIDESAYPVVLDLSGVTFIDSTALGVLIGANERSHEHGIDFRIVVNEARIMKVFEITGLTELLTLYPTVTE